MPSTSRWSRGKSDLYLLDIFSFVRWSALRPDHTIFPARFGEDRGGGARFDLRTELVGERGGRFGAVAGDDVEDPAAFGAAAGELPVRDRRLGGVDEVVEHGGGVEAVRRGDGVVAAAFDSREHVAFVFAAAGAAVDRGLWQAYEIADVVAQERHPGAPERGDDDARQAAAGVDELDVRVARVVVQPPGGALHEEHAGFGGAVELADVGRRERFLDRSRSGARGLLVGERDERGRVHRDLVRQRVAAQRGEVLRVGLDAVGAEVVPLGDHARELAVVPQRRIGNLVQKEHPVDRALLTGERADVTGRAAAHRRREHRLAEAVAHGLVDAGIEAHRLALLRIPPRPLPEHLQAILRGARGRDDLDEALLHRVLQIARLAHQRLRE